MALKDFGNPEPGGICPVPLAKLEKLYRAYPGEIVRLIAEMPEDRRIRLAVFCYGRPHLRDVGLAIAAICDEARLAEMAGMMGMVLAAQCRAKVGMAGGERPQAAGATPPVGLTGSAR